MITADVMHSGTDTTLGWDMMLLAMILLILAALLLDCERAFALVRELFFRTQR
jgi:hypothetical protein